MKEFLEQEKTVTVESALANIPMSELEANGYPILTHIPKSEFQVFGNVREDKLGYNETGADKKIIRFWQKIFDKENFLTTNTVQFNPRTDFLFILHSFKDSNGIDCIFKAITTNYKEFIKDPANWINYDLHGKICENRSQGDYPTINFWDFYDHKLNTKRDQYRIPDSNWRKSFYKNI